MGWFSRWLGGAAEQASVRALNEAVYRAEPEFLALDVETASSNRGSICQVGIVGFSGGQEVLSWSQLIDPREAFDGFNTNLHGISAATVRGAPCFTQALPRLHDLINDRLTVAHSAFDRGAITEACRSWGHKEPSTRWVDSVLAARVAWPDLPNHKLNTVSQHLGIPLNHHDALSDARAAGLILIHAVEKTGVSPEDWLSPSKRKSASLAAKGIVEPVKTRSRKPTGTGSLSGERVVMTGDFRLVRSVLADKIALAGGQVSSSVSSKTTILVVGDEKGHVSEKRRRAIELASQGSSIQTIGEDELMRRLGL